MRTTPVMLSVTQLNAYVKSLFDGDSHLNSVFLAERFLTLPITINPVICIYP